jgi:EmrB/QacA subfamily drug resistance transporter
MSRRIVPFVVASALFMEGMDATIVATALPTIARDLGIDAVALKLAITSYLVGMAIFIPVSGWVADRFGARTTFRLAITLYLVASLGCAFGETLEAFVGWRFAQGVGAAMMTPVGRMVVVRTVPKPELVAALAALTVPALFGPILGPLAAGVIVTYADWRWIFLLNVPIGLVGIVLATLYFDDTRPAPTPLDRRGFALAALAVTGLIAAVTGLGSRHLVPLWSIVAAVAVGLLATVLFVRHAHRTPRPLLDLGLFSLVTFDAGIVGGSLFRLAVGASAFLLPLMLQLGLGYDPLTSGLVTFLGAVGALLTKFIGKAILDRFGFRRVLLVNAGFAVGSVAALAAVGHGTPLAVVGVLVLLGGITRSLQFTSLHALTYADVEPGRAGAASAIASVAQQVSLSMGVAIGALVLELSQTGAGRTAPAVADFAVALLAVSALASTCLVKIVALPTDAGHALRTPRRHDAP